MRVCSNVKVCASARRASNCTSNDVSRRFYSGFVIFSLIKLGDRKSNYNADFPT